MLCGGLQVNGGVMSAAYLKRVPQGLKTGLLVADWHPSTSLRAGSRGRALPRYFSANRWSPANVLPSVRCLPTNSTSPTHKVVCYERC